MREDRETLLGTTCSEPFTVVRNNDNTEGASYSPIQIPIKHSWDGWSIGSVQVQSVACPRRKYVASFWLLSGGSSRNEARPSHPLPVKSTFLVSTTKGPQSAAAGSGFYMGMCLKLSSVPWPAADA